MICPLCKGFGAAPEERAREYAEALELLQRQWSHFVELALAVLVGFALGLLVAAVFGRGG